MSQSQIDILDLGCRNVMGCMSDDAFKVAAEKTFKPQQMRIVSCFASIHDICDIFSHYSFILARVCERQLLPDQTTPFVDYPFFFGICILSIL